MAGTFPHVINMANSIIGVSILSMPYCFKESGLVLGVILILLSGFITKKTCMFLIKAAIMSRRRSYELLAFQVFGVTGKLFMELCMILFLIGICVSFHVVMGDLAPSIVAKYMTVKNSPALRCTLLVGIMLLVILPLCLLRNLDSLASMSMCSIGFYVFLNIIILYLALPNLLDGSWISHARLFRLDNAFRVLPIMTLALSCQSNVFEIYDSIPEPDVTKMRSVVGQAVNICCALYIGVGFLGYVAFVDADVGGNIIMVFPVSRMTDGITMFFVFSLAISFPLMMFPCRTSIHSLIYKRNTQVSYDIVGNYMPEVRFKGITLCVLTISLVMGIMLPSIEFVLGLLGSTMGVTIALILPSIFYIRVYTKNSCDRFFAQGFLLLGILLMVTGTYLNLMESNAKAATVLQPVVESHIQRAIDGKSAPVIDGVLKKISDDGGIKSNVANVVAENVRKEPAIPEPPPNSPLKETNEVLKEKPKEQLKEPVAVNQEKTANAPSEKTKKSEDPPPAREPETLLHPDALKRDESEKQKEGVKEASKETSKDLEKQQERVLKQMEKQQKEQKKLLEEQKKILNELKQQKEEAKNDTVKKAAVERESDTKKDARRNINNVVKEKPKLVLTIPKKAKTVDEVANVKTELKNEALPKENEEAAAPIVEDVKPVVAESLEKIKLMEQPVQVDVQEKTKKLVLENVKKINVLPESRVVSEYKKQNEAPPQKELNAAVLPEEHHDEERRKRSLPRLQVSNQLSPMAVDAASDVKLSPDGKPLVDAVYDSRRLLSIGLRTRRKKRRHEQFPEYSDEM